MQTKLTSHLEKEFIEHAKLHAKQQGNSLTQIVANYSAHTDIAPVTKSLIGILKNTELDQSDYKNQIDN